jgi:hypothetical protein
MMVIGHWLLYEDKDSAVCCMMFIDLLDGDVQQVIGSKYLEYNPGSELNTLLLIMKNNEIELNKIIEQQ